MQSSFGYCPSYCNSTPSYGVPKLQVPYPTAILVEYLHRRCISFATRKRCKQNLFFERKNWVQCLHRRCISFFCVLLQSPYIKDSVSGGLLSVGKTRSYRDVQSSVLRTKSPFEQALQGLALQLLLVAKRIHLLAKLRFARKYSTKIAVGYGTCNFGTP